tara:strand:- start:1227 stop:4751 length:3525 start_codon:yes stop_codon:yes gene_type:complete
MTIQTQELDLTTTPLRGHHLIEASAGTGKTYTLAGLVLRHLLGHGQTTPLNIEQILVVTFTNAATEELKDRIRRKIQLAYQAFIGCRVEDPLIELLVQEADAQQKQKSMQWLDLALRSLDQAAIYTIHSFCHRLLQERAFESGQLFEFQYELDDTPWCQQAIRDIWRRICYPMDSTTASLIYSYCKTPDELYAQYIRPVLGKKVEMQPQLPPFKELCERHNDHLKQLKALWISEKEVQLECLCGLPLNGVSYGKADQNHPKLHQAWQHIDQWLTQDKPLDAKMLSKLTYSNLKLKKGGVKPDPQILSLPVAFDNWQEAQHKQRIFAAFLQQVKVQVEAELIRIKQQKNCLSSDDLLSRLHHALHQHPEAEALCQQIRTLYPVALIDEFQDTDPIQYEIFHKIYQHSTDEQGWFMIGDPKQAIYSFRGADIFTYMKAKFAVNSHLSLKNNYRSSKRMIEAVNHLFMQHEQAFIYHDAIHFQAVGIPNTDRDEALQLSTQAAMHYRLITADSQDLNKADAMKQAAQDCAQRIASYLHDARQGVAKIKERSLQPKDIAILVRDRHQAESVRQALQKHHINSVFLSRNPVFATEQAYDLKFIVQAMAEPKQESALRSALATRTLGLPFKAIEAFNHDEEQRVYWLEKFFQYHQTWQKQNWLSALTDLMHDCQVAPRLLQHEHGARQLTDLRHLSEIIQEQSQRLSGQQALLNWYDAQLNAEHIPEQQQLRLESEHDLIQIVTIHKSKGLEYNLCFLPFISFDQHKVQSNEATFYHQPETHAAMWHCLSSAAEKELAMQENLAESMRLLYVALTRAKYYCEVTLVHITKTNKKNETTSQLYQSAIGYLLGCQKETDHQQLQEKLTQLCHTEQTHSLFHQVDIQDTQIYRSETVQSSKVLELNPCRLQVHQSWRLSSYSALTQNMSGTHAHPLLLQETNDHIEDIRFQFEKGAHAGNFLHFIFENIEFDQAESLSKALPEAMQKHLIDAHWYEGLQAWIHDVLHTPLYDDFCLAQLTSQSKYVEMEFHLPVHHLSHTHVNRLLVEYGYQATPSLTFEDLHGMLKGFIDLWFTWQGRFYVADYKSNYLGTQTHDYEQASLKHAIGEHRYDLQYLIYSVALHRYLKQCVPDYDYDVHFGGCFYLFLRGMWPQQGHQSGVYFDRPDPELIAKLDQCFTEGDQS